MGKNICNIFLLSLLSCFLFGETKIGYIDSQIILTQYEDVRQVQVELEKEQNELAAYYFNPTGNHDSPNGDRSQPCK